MQYDAISFDISDNIAVLTLNRPERKNALNSKMRTEITDAIAEAARSARVLVLTGAGDAFCSGQDLADAGNPADLDLEKTLREEYEPMLAALTQCAVPTIAAVNGAAAGAGANPTMRKGSGRRARAGIPTLVQL